MEEFVLDRERNQLVQCFCETDYSGERAFLEGPESREGKGCDDAEEDAHFLARNKGDAEEALATVYLCSFANDW